MNRYHVYEILPHKNPDLRAEVFVGVFYAHTPEEAIYLARHSSERYLHSDLVLQTTMELGGLS